MALVRENILENIQTVLSGILTDAGYNNDIESVQRYKQRGNSLIDVPCIVVAAGPEGQKPGPDPTIECVLTVELDLWTRQDKDNTSDTDTILNSLLSDIIKAMYADYTRGGYAHNTTIVNVFPFETVDENPHTGLIIEVEIQYFYDRNHPEQAF